MTDLSDNEEPGPISRRASHRSRRTLVEIGVYFFVAMLFYNLGTPGASGVANIPTQFLLKDRLHFGPLRTANFNFITSLPLYVGFVFGFLRDRWRPFGRGDLAYLYVTPILIASGYFWLALGPISYTRLVAATLGSAAAGVLLGAALQALMTEVAHRDALAGRLAAIVMVTTYVPQVIAPWAGGQLQKYHIPPEFTFRLSGCLALVVSAFALWRPRSVFPVGGSDADRSAATSWHALKRLLTYRQLYLPALIMFLWNFAPGWLTPLFYYLSDHVKLSDEVVGNFNAVQNGTLALFAALYGLLCRRYPLRMLLLIGTVLGIFGNPLFLLIHSERSAMGIAALTGASVGIALSAYYDLLLRACPKELEGATFMFGAGMLALSNQASDVFGSWLYQRGGYSLALIASTIATILILPLLPLIPSRLTSSRDGEPLAELTNES